METEQSAKLPGMTRTFGNPCDALVPSTSLRTIVPPAERKVILLATAAITDSSIFNNGLFQNVFVFYKMFSAMGYSPILVVNEMPKPESVPKVLRDCRMMPTEKIITNPLPVVAMIEIGMSVDPLLREFVKMLGGRLAKVYLGNILNIDIETPIFYPQMHFAHHVIEKIDRIWTSPHYGQHAEYAAFLNHVQPPENLADMIAPYVWDPCFITRGGEQQPRWRAPETPEDETFVVMEPNISIQKGSLLPLLAIESWYRRYGKAAGWKGKVIVVNGDRLVANNPYFSTVIAPTLDIFTDKRVTLMDRITMAAAMSENPSATFVCHNITNEYNYMVLELLWCGFPVVHNAGSWSAYGYSYDGNNVVQAADRIEQIRATHVSNLDMYHAHAATLAWRHSPYNPEMHAAWEALLKK